MQITYSYILVLSKLIGSFYLQIKLKAMWVRITNLDETDHETLHI